MKLNDLKEKLSEEIFGQSRREAIAAGVCIQCGRPALDHCYSEAGRREYLISGLCEECFDRITGGDDEV